METLAALVKQRELTRKVGRINKFVGLLVEAIGPEVFVGERCLISSSSHDLPIQAEVVGINEEKVLLMPFGDLKGIRLGSHVIGTSKGFEVPVGEPLMGRVIDAFAQPLDGKDRIRSTITYPLHGKVINPLARPKITRPMKTGVRSIDSLLTVGEGQRVGIFAGSGVGKSSLLGTIAKDSRADVNVIALVGERGRELVEFLEDTIGTIGLSKSVVVVATSDQPALMRVHAALTATTIAEYFRDQGLHVLLMMDSITRFAMAQREIGLSVGEPPTARGYTPSVFASLPKLLERAGVTSTGSITAFYTVLVEGDDLDDPIADSLRSLLDGHIVLSRRIANQGKYPPVDVLNSRSRVMDNVVTSDHVSNARQVREMLGIYDRSCELIDIGAYKAGSNKQLDKVVASMPSIDNFLFGESDGVEAEVVLAQLMDKLR